MAVKVLVVTKGHGFNYNGFYSMFDDNPELLTTQVEQPAAQVLLRPENVAEYEAVCFYDMWGVDFSPAPEEYQQSIAALLESGKGLMLMNHALVEWPAWPGWRDVSGTSFLLREGEVFGEMTPGSGYRGGGADPRGNGRGKVTPDPAAAHRPPRHRRNRGPRHRRNRGRSSTTPCTGSPRRKLRRAGRALPDLEELRGAARHPAPHAHRLPA